MAENVATEKEIISTTLQKFGYLRTARVLGNSVNLSQQSDGTEELKKWVKSLNIPQEGKKFFPSDKSEVDYNLDYKLGCSPDEVLSLCRCYQESYRNLGLLNKSICTPYEKHQNLSGEVVLFPLPYYSSFGTKMSAKEQICFVERDETTPNQKMRYLEVRTMEGYRKRWPRADCIGIISPAKLPVWAKEELEKLKTNPKVDNYFKYFAKGTAFPSPSLEDIRYIARSSEHFLVAESNNQKPTTFMIGYLNQEGNSFLVEDSEGWFGTDYLEARGVFQEKYEKLEVNTMEQEQYTQEDCNSEITEFTNQILILKAEVMKPEYQNQENQLWLATHGSGCQEGTNYFSDTVHVTCLIDNDSGAFARVDFLGVAKEEILPDWAKEKRDELLAERNTPDDWQDR